MEFTPETHNLCVTETNQVIINENGQVLLQENSTGNLVYVDVTPSVAEVFHLNINTTPNTSDNCSNNLNGVHDLQSCKAVWSRSATLMLIQSYKNHLNDFKSTTMKNSKVWSIISGELRVQGHEYTSAQCTDKFTYLKGQYTKKVDNMSDKSSGAARINFDFMEEMDEIFGKKPNIHPPSIASSSRKPLVENDNKTDEQEPSTSRQTKKRKVSAAQWLELEKENMRHREARHRERIELQREAIKAFNDVVQQLLRTLDK